MSDSLVLSLQKGDRVLVVGATGGVGQLTVGQLVEQKIPVRAMTRDRRKAEGMFDSRVEIAIADSRIPQTLTGAMDGITHIICCTGTTAFPSARWEFDLSGLSDLEKGLAWGRIFFDADYRQKIALNSPMQVDFEGTKALIAAAPSALKRFVFVSSLGITRRDTPPFSVLNSFGVLNAKALGEEALIKSGLPYTIVRPGRLVDGPFTSYDLNTLLKSRTHGKRGIILGQGDTLGGETSRIDVAQACVESLKTSHALNQIFEVVNKGDRPAQLNWANLFNVR